MGVAHVSDIWSLTNDAIGSPIDGTMEVRKWASYRGQTLARTTRGVMEYARAFRMLAFMELQLAYIGREVEAIMPPALTAQGSVSPGVLQRPPTALGSLMLMAAVGAEWLTCNNISYLCCCQKYADTGPEDLVRSSDINYLLKQYPLLSVAYFRERKRDGEWGLQSVYANAKGVMYCINIPGHPIKDDIGEGKPENQNNGAPYIRSRMVQVLDMNQEGYVEEAMKLPNVLREFEPNKSVMRVSHQLLTRLVEVFCSPAIWLRCASMLLLLVCLYTVRFECDVLTLSTHALHLQPVALVGMREHIFTQDLSTPALFMSYQESQFGVVWQRIMHQPMKVRLHYGHPDIIDKVFMHTRGGFSKASRFIQVSEDVFAGMTAMLRGGESKQIEYMQVSAVSESSLGSQLQVFDGLGLEAEAFQQHCRG